MAKELEKCGCGKSCMLTRKEARFHLAWVAMAGELIDPTDTAYWADLTFVRGIPHSEAMKLTILDVHRVSLDLSPVPSEWALKLADEWIDAFWSELGEVT